MKWTKADTMCYRKKRYPSLISASAGIGHMRANYADALYVNWQTYECPICRGFHITKQSQDNPEYQKRRWMAGLDNTPKYAIVSV